ncbi:TIGR04219 family outer membrane beta-barrel protein [Vibrio zhugei]|uniref:TIGR04219 family outer membrane beta-barrel protein n=1 Tax=Vibrio zhugei TaxID=2479546 RepID=A0ABV7C6V5_9VIBR|nr:TIGR04219 family outer membrane beta-barrel protein [Vibrio zhugei]
MKILGCCLLFFVAFSTYAVDPFYSTQVGTQVWLGEVQGSGARSQPTNVPSLSLSLEHGFPILPNVSIRYTNLDESDVAYDAVAYTGYYRWLQQPFVRFDIGLTMTSFNRGEYLGQDGRMYEFDGDPLSLYAYGEVDLPYWPWALFGDIQTQLDGSRDLEYQDWSLGLQWLLPIQTGELAVQSGYRNSQLDLNHLSLSPQFDDPQAIKISGWFFGVLLTF